LNKKEEIIQIAKIIKEKFLINKIILFGSYAYGNPNNNSDIDICIITNDEKRKLEIIREIRKFVIPFLKAPLDLLVYKVEEFKNRAEIKSTIEYKIKNEGILL